MEIKYRIGRLVLTSFTPAWPIKRRSRPGAQPLDGFGARAGAVLGESIRRDVEYGLRRPHP